MCHSGRKIPPNGISQKLSNQSKQDGWRRESACVLSGGSQSLALPLETGSGRFPGWCEGGVGGGMGEGAPLRGPRVEVHSQCEHSYAESPGWFGCRFLFAVTCRCLSAAAVVQTLISLLPVASVEWVVQSSGQL